MTKDEEANEIVRRLRGPQEIDCSKVATIAFQLNGNFEFSIANAIVGQNLTIIIHQDSVGGRRVTYPDNFVWLEPYGWEKPNGYLIVHAIYDGSHWRCTSLKDGCV